MNYKIRVNNEEESEEAQELFFELGYVWHDTKCKTQMRYVEPVYYSSFDDMELACDVSDVNYKHKEITLPGLRALVVLKRNSIDDANAFRHDNGVKYYITSDNKYYYFSNLLAFEWTESCNDIDYLEKHVKPIEKPMKEYLDPENDYKFIITDKPFFDWIEIPEGAQSHHTSKTTSVNFFLMHKDGIFFYNYGEKWISWGDFIKDSLVKFNTTWSRHTIPEELPFVDDEPKTKIGELYVDLEVNVDVDINSSLSKHNHYFIDVSDVDEVDFYEIALRYNVTDPCIQHILKKCLAAGNRGHKDFHTDLKDIYDTAVRALRIHGG